MDVGKEDASGFPLALTFDDVMLVPQASDVLPNEADTSTMLCNGLELNLPILSRRWTP
jgi:IMP dehydrogenase